MAEGIIRSAFSGPEDEFSESGKKPVVFDVIAPDGRTSLLPDPSLSLVLHVNPTSMRFSYAANIVRTQMHSGFVEEHWGPTPTTIAFEAATGGFVRLYSGLTAITGPTPSNDLLPPGVRARGAGGTRRDTIAYDKYLDLLALYKYNGAIYDSRGTIALQGSVRVLYDGGSWWGWFSDFSVEESAEKPYQFSLTANFTLSRETHQLRSAYLRPRTLPAAGPEVTSRPPSSLAPELPLTDAAFDRAEDSDLFGVDLASVIGPPSPAASPPVPPSPRRARHR